MTTAPTEIRPGDIIVGLIDSIMAHGTLTGNDGATGDSTPSFISRVNADFAYPHVARCVGSNRARVVGGNFARTVPVTDLHRQVTLVNSGVSGNQIEDLEPNVATRVTAHSPTVVIGLGCVNNVDGVISEWNPTTFTTLFQSTITQIFENNPGVRLIWTSSAFVGECYTNGNPPVFGPNVGSHDADLEAQSLIIKSIVEAAGGQFKDIRNGDGALVAWEVINNPNNDASGHALKIGDGLHPSQLGAREIDLILYNSIRTVP